MFRKTILRLSAFAFLLLCAGVSVRAQQGDGDLPPLPKSKPKTTPTTRTKATPRPTPRVPTFREPASLPPLAFNQPMDGGLDGQTAGRIPPGTYFNEHLLTATTSDLFTIQLQSANPSLTVQLTDNNRMDVPLVRDERTGVYRVKNADGVVPADGEYRVRVLVNASAPPQPILYKLTVTRTGLTEAGYAARLDQIIKDFNAQRDVNAAASRLEALTKDDPNRPGAFEYLGVLYIESSGDLVKATTAMTQAIKLGGAALFRITHDSRWRRPEREGRGPGLKIAWPDARTNWLKIYKDKLVITDLVDEKKNLLELGGAQIQNFGRVAISPVVFIKHNLRTLRPDNISFSVRNPPEAELVVDLINNFVAHKNPRAPRLLKEK